MSELRYDPLGGFWVNIASIRAERPNEFRRIETRRADAICPFCAGQELRTPTSILELSHSGEPGGHRAAQPWQVRVIPNMYPAFSSVAKPQMSSTGPYGTFTGGGLHEIIVESPRHVTSISQLTDDELRLSIQAYQLRIQAAYELDDIRQVTLFKNCRSEAGASIEHVHSQMIASPVMPDSLAARFERSSRAVRETGRALLDTIVRFETQENRRMIESRGGFAAFCPFASRFAFQIWIVDVRAGRESFERLPANDLADLCRLVRSCIERLERVLADPPYNLVLHLPPKMPLETSPQEIFPWFIEIIPRLGRLAGFELAGGGWITDQRPEDSAEKLRGDSN